jgi:5-methyltetrahydropteroyltriglutamate--homocysteine methyltransferase
MTTTNLGYPRIGPDRELKRALEGYWHGKIGRDALLEQARAVMMDNWRRQAATGVEVLPSNDFSLYDHVLDHIAMFGLVPDGYGWHGGEVDLDTYFAMARGTDTLPALEMTKWFDTNYHYISAELTGDFQLTANRPLHAWEFARNEAGLDTRPVVVGPYTFLRLQNNPRRIPLDRLLARLLPLYRQILAELATAGVAWVQMDEPTCRRPISTSSAPRTRSWPPDRARR